MRKKLFENRFSLLIMQNYGSVLKVSKREEDINRIETSRKVKSVYGYFFLALCVQFFWFFWFVILDKNL